jgi:hypothetical protein
LVAFVGAVVVAGLCFLCVALVAVFVDDAGFAAGIGMDIGIGMFGSICCADAGLGETASADPSSSAMDRCVIGSWKVFIP